MGTRWGGLGGSRLCTRSPPLSTDLNECEVYKREGGPRLCAHACVNLPGSYRCACPGGYVLLGDGKSCEGEGVWGGRLETCAF